MNIYAQQRCSFNTSAHFKDTGPSGKQTTIWPNLCFFISGNLFALYSYIHNLTITCKLERARKYYNAFIWEFQNIYHGQYYISFQLKMFNLKVLKLGGKNNF